MASDLASRKYVPYGPGISKVPDTEAADIQNVKDTFAKLISFDNEAHGHTYPTTHARTLGVVKGKLIIPDGLPKHLKQGPFAKPGEHPVVMRYSFNNHNVGADSRTSLGRAVTIKIFDLPGERFPEGSGNTTQDFMFNSQIAVSELSDARTAKEIINIFFTGLTDEKAAREEILKRKDLALQTGLNRQPKRHVEAMDFYSQFAYRFGDYVAKHGLFPVTDAQKKLVDATIPPEEGTAANLTNYIKNYYGANDAVYEWRFQLLENEADQPVEYAGTEWDPVKYPYQTVAKLVFPKQDSYLYELKAFWEDTIKVNAWRGLKTLEPLGGSNRMRRQLYPMSKKMREHLNGREAKDVQKIEDLPGPIPQGAEVVKSWKDSIRALH